MTSPPDPLQPRFPAPPATVSRERVKRPPKPNFCSGWKTKRREGTACDRSFSQHYAPRAAGRAPLAVPARRSALVQGHPPWRGRYRPASTHGCGPGVKPAPAPSRTDLTGRAEWRVDACGSRAAGQPAPPAGIRAASPRQRRGRAVGHRPGPPAPALPAFPSGRAGPPATSRSAPRPGGCSGGWPPRRSRVGACTRGWLSTACTWTRVIMGAGSAGRCWRRWSRCRRTPGSGPSSPGCFRRTRPALRCTSGLGSGSSGCGSVSAAITAGGGTPC